MALRTRPLSDAIGIEILGVDLSQDISPEVFAGILGAWHRHLVILFRDQDISAEDQIRFARMFGGLEEVRSRPSYSKENIMFVANRSVEGKEGVLPEGEMQFHCDQCYYEVPSRATLLCAIEIPSKGGNTRFANMQRAYASLPTALRQRLDGMKALHVYDYDANPAVRKRESSPDAPRFVHPVVIRHPETGTPALYVNRLMTHRIEGLEEEESDRLLEQLWQHSESPQFVYEHVWKPGDLIMWDNLCSMHARTDFDPAETRVLRRLTVRGERPVAFRSGVTA